MKNEDYEIIQFFFRMFYFREKSMFKLKSFVSFEHFFIQMQIILIYAFLASNKFSKPYFSYREWIRKRLEYANGPSKKKKIVICTQKVSHRLIDKLDIQSILTIMYA